MFEKIFYKFIIIAIAFLLTSFANKASAAEDKGLLFNENPVIENASLAEMRGAALSPEVLGVAIFDAFSANNASNGTVSGGNMIDAGAFSHASGLSTVIQNSGNNVLIQSATILNVNLN